MLALCGTLPLAIVRTHPVAAALVLTAAAGVTLGSPPSPTVAGVVALLVALYVVGRHRPRWVAVLSSRPGCRGRTGSR